MSINSRGSMCWAWTFLSAIILFREVIWNVQDLILTKKNTCNVSLLYIGELPYWHKTFAWIGVNFIALLCLTFLSVILNIECNYFEIAIQGIPKSPAALNIANECNLTITPWKWICSVELAFVIGIFGRIYTEYKTK